MAAAHRINSRLPLVEQDLTTSGLTYDYKFDTTKAERIFNIKYHTMDETCRDVLAQIKDEWIA